MIRCFVDGVNVISGVRKLDFAPSDRRNQDYIILPEQPWLYGFLDAQGHLRQFFASSQESTESTSTQDLTVKTLKGYKPWKFMSGKEAKMPPQTEKPATAAKASSIELEITRAFELDRMSFSRIRNVCFIRGQPLLGGSNPVSGTGAELDPLLSPKDMKLRLGDLVYMKDLKTRRHDRVKITGDLVQECLGTGLETIYLQALYDPYQTQRWKVVYESSTIPALDIEV
jgi:hypothetical protein